MKDSDRPEWQKGNGTETIDAREFLPPNATISGSFDLTEAKNSSFGKLLDALPTPTAVVNGSTVITFANIAFIEITGCAEGLQGRPLLECLRPKNHSSMDSLIKNSFMERKARVIQATLRTPRTVLWARMHLRPIRFGKERELLVLVENLTAEKKRLILAKRHRREMRKAHEQLEQKVHKRTAELMATNGHLQDEIARRMRMEQRLEKEKRFFGMALDSLPGIFYFCDERGTLLRWNRNLEKSLGYNASEISGRSFLDFFSSRQRQAIDSGIGQIMEKGAYAAEAELLTKDGRTIPFLLNSVCVSIDQRPYFLGMGIDMSDRKETEKALQESELRYRTLFDESRDGIFITMPNGMLVAANQSCLDIFACARKEMIGAGFSETCASPSDWYNLCEQIERDGSVKDYQIRLKRHDGSTMDCRITASMRRAHDGTVLGYHGVVRDVTAQVQAEKRIREQNAFLNSLLESLTHPFYVIDATNHQILHANSAARNLFASHGATCYEATAGLTEPCTDVDPACPVSEVNRTGRSVTVEHVSLDDLGKPRHLEIHAYPIAGDDGNVSKVIKYAVDVTERRQTEQALRESEERMRLVIQASPIGIAIVQDGRYLYANPALAVTFGYPDPQAIVGRHAHHLFADVELAMLETQAHARRYGAASSSPLEVTGVRHNGEYFDASVWVTAIDFQGKPSLLGFVIDMSKEKALRAKLVQAQKMEAIGTLAGGIAHDFNNLLTIIQGFAELVLLEMNENDSSHADLLQVLRAARNGADLVRRILTFSSHLEPRLRPVDLNHEVKQVETLLRRTIPKMIEIELDLEEPLTEISGDPGQIEQILLNLAVNAQHAMPEGGKLLIQTRNIVLDDRDCRERIDVNPGLHVLLTVTDSGHGMEKDVLDHIFEPFFSTKKPGEGTGLGLSMVFGIVKGHGGAITCRSKTGMGTTFEMCFPASTTLEKADIETVEPGLAHGTETILVVDDEEPIRDLAIRILSRAGYHVLTASQGPEALDIYRGKQDEIALVLLDVIMPVMSGPQCLEKLLEINPRVKILVTSGFAITGATKQTLLAGSKGFVSKPFQTSEVLASLRRILDGTDA